MSDFYSGNSVNCVLLDVNLYETKRENNWYPIPEVGKTPVRVGDYNWCSQQRSHWGIIKDNNGLGKN